MVSGEIHVKLFGPAKQYVGAGEVVLPVEAALPVRICLRELEDRYGTELGRLFEVSRFAVGEAIVDEEFSLFPGSTLVVLPPVSGGQTDQAPIRLVLVDDHEVIIDGLRAMLSSFSAEVQLVGAVKSRHELEKLLSEVTADMVLTDAKLKAESGFDVLEMMAEKFPEIPVMFYTAYDDEAYLFRALRGGARGYILKQASGEELVSLVRRAYEGEVTLDPSMAGRVALMAARLQFGEFWPGAHLGLTQRESEILELVVKGMSNRDIAQSLFLGEETVKSHLSSIYRKLKVKGRAEAVAVALREVTFR